MKAPRLGREKRAVRWWMVTAIAAFVVVASSLPARASAWTEGAKTLLFMRVDFSDMPGEPLTVAAAQSLINNDVNNFYIQNSYNKTSLSVTVVPTVLRMPQTTAFYGADNHVQLLDDARVAALSAGYNSANYDLDVVAFDYISAFKWAGLGYVGGKGTWLNDYFDLHVTGHEVGHNYGLGHANLWDTTDGSVIGDGSSDEYGDLYDVMGSGGTTGSHFNAFFKNHLDWIAPAGVQTVSSSGTYRIQQHDSIASTGVRALKIAKDGSTNYWVEFRQALTTNNWVMNGAVLHWEYNNSLESDLLDTTPETTSANDAALLIGRTLSDTNAGIHITPIGKGGTSPESLDVVVNIGNFSGNQAPTLSINPTSSTVNSGTAINFTATASDADGDTLSYCWDFGDTTFASTANPTKSWTTGGNYTVRCTVSDRKGGTASATASITVVATYIVTNTNDSGAGSLRAAIDFANANTGTNIVFNIPTSSSGYQNGVFSIKPLSALPSLNSTGIIMDGATQTAFTGNTNTSGPEVMIDGTSAGTGVSGAGISGLVVYNSNCAIKNLVISGFSASGMQMAGSSANNNTVQGCYIGTNASGTAALPNTSWGIVLYAGAHHNTFGGTGAGQGNVISGNRSQGIEFQQANTSNNVVQGNFIGTNAAGTGAVANNNGVFLRAGAQNNTIGGSAAARNVISGNNYAGVYLNGGGTTATSGNIVQSNYIGVDVNGANAIPNHHGIMIYGGGTNNVTNNTIGGVGNGNLIASNGGDGISVVTGCVGNPIRANAIYGNNGLGINLVDPNTGYGVNANDAGDADTGANNWQNFPVITGASGSSSGTVNFTLNSIANRVYTIDVFRNTAADSSGYGEGAVYVGSQDVTTDGSGNANGSLTFSNVPGGSFFTATATDTTTGDTSEFGQAMQMSLTPASLQFSSATYNVSESGVSATITVTRTANSEGAVSVSYATSNGTATAGSDYTAATSTLSWNSGDTTDKTFTVPVTDDTSLEADETVNLTLITPSGSAVLGTQNTALLTIADNESVLSIADATSAIEGSAAEPGTVTFELSLSPASNQSVTVDYTTTNDSAQAGSDYAAKSGTITFEPGQTSRSVTISLIGDALNEATETFVVTLANANGATITDAQAVGTISDDDIAPSVSVGDASVTEGDTGSVNAVFAVTLSGASSQTVTVTYAASNGTTNPATVGSDYTAANGTLTFNAGETSKNLSV
ncbi:MAG TPA: Calx-beta domain-containing protein, partial [Abditibacteriaceae bacterium]